MDTSNMTPEQRERFNYKMSVCHTGPCSSPYKDKCPCPNDCPLHGRCCDCIHLHIKNRKLRGGAEDDFSWLPACVKLSYEGKFDELYINDNPEAVKEVECRMDITDMSERDLEHHRDKMRVSHEGPCSSPYYGEHCPCNIEGPMHGSDCPLHGRCCDCVHHHLDSTIRNGGIVGFAKEFMLWMTACQRCAQQGRFDEIYIEDNSEK